MPRILSTGCTSSAGPKSLDFWQGLVDGKDHSQPVALADQTLGDLQACLWQTPNQDAPLTSRQLLVHQLLHAWQDAWSSLEERDRRLFPRDENLGVILASTKGSIEDFIWDNTEAGPVTQSRDPFTGILDRFLLISELSTPHTLCVSNACASSLSALFLAKAWIDQKRVSHVLVLAVDQIAGKFVLQGFHALHALSPTSTRPFSRDRDGLDGRSRCRRDSFS